jgi:hypothetical protein
VCNPCISHLQLYCTGAEVETWSAVRAWVDGTEIGMVEREPLFCLPLLGWLSPVWIGACDKLVCLRGDALVTPGSDGTIEENQLVNGFQLSEGWAVCQCRFS